jgi:hypothetical protein
LDPNKKDKSPTARKGKTLVRQALTSIAGIITEAGKVYREVRTGKLDHEEARSLVWILSQLRAMVETKALADIEDKLETLANGGTIHGHETSNRETQRPH